jgi:ribose transport system permease protein
MNTHQPARSWAIGEFTWVWIATALLFGVSAVVAPGTLRASALTSMLPFAAMLAIVAVGQTIVIQQRGLDMSSAGLVSMGGFLVTMIGFATDSMVVGVVATVLIAALAGCLNGLLIARLNILPIVATLATNAVFMGAVLSLSGGTPHAVPRSLEAFSHNTILDVPYTLILAVLFIACVSLVTNKTIGGRRFIAVGANPRAAAAAGIHVLSYQVGTYAAAAICFAVAGILYAGFIGSASQSAGNDYLLPGIAAVVVGGTPFTGGRGSALASGVAAIFMSQLGQMVLALGAGTAQQLLVQAGAIVIAVALRNLGSLTAFLKARPRLAHGGVSRPAL